MGTRNTVDGLYIIDRYAVVGYEKSLNIHEWHKKNMILLTIKIQNKKYPISAFPWKGIKKLFLKNNNNKNMKYDIFEWPAMLSICKAWCLLGYFISLLPKEFIITFKAAGVIGIQQLIYLRSLQIYSMIFMTEENAGHSLCWILLSERKLSPSWAWCHMHLWSTVDSGFKDS